MGYNLSIIHGHWSNDECIAVNPKTGELKPARTTTAITARLPATEECLPGSFSLT
jgi:hypothetical protein